MEKTHLINLISENTDNRKLKEIALKVINKQRISKDEGLILYKEAELGFLGMLANFVRESMHSDKTFFNRNIHLEPTNICIYNCKFCSYSKRFNDSEAWELKIDEILEKVKDYKNKNITEIHIVGGVHPERDIFYYGNLLKKIKEILPEIHIKAFTAVELDYMFRKAGMTIEEGFKFLQKSGLDSIPGGGAEIFDAEIRKQICHEKSNSELWLNIHETAHKLGIQSNATMLYGHVENYSHRIDHLERLRKLQDKTGGFNSFIPLKFRNKNNKLSNLKEVSVIEDLKNYAVSRIFLDNIQHIKAYWVMIGIDIAQTALSFGVDDIDGTIDDTTKIYSMAGVNQHSTKLNSEQLVSIIKAAKRIPVERDTLYNIINQY